MKVKQLAMNQVILADENGAMFFSYGTLIMIAKKGSKIVLDTNFWNYSRTTVKYLCQALYIDGGINEIRKAIKEGRYILEDLQTSEYEIIKKA